MEGELLMRKMLPLILTLALLAGLAVPAYAAGVTPKTGSNVSARSYGGYSSRNISSYLFPNNKGGLTRVEGTTVEEYNSSFQLLNSREIPTELNIYGGFFAGSEYNFFFFGQGNSGESDNVEVMRVVKYSKDWQRLGQASIYGENTQTPFRSGTLRCAEYRGVLYVHTCHTMYKSQKDGKNHQSCMMLSILESTMNYERTVGFYVSHSFDQYVLADQQGNLVGVDLGDAYPRGIALQRIPDFQSVTLHEIPGAIGNNYTGICLGGLAETTNNYVVSYLNRNSSASGGEHNYLIFADKNTLTPREVKLTAQPGATAPAVVPTGLNGGYVLWNGGNWLEPDSTLYYAAYSDDGTVGPVQTAKAYLSPCQPIVFNGKVVWYVTNGSIPVFYTLDASGLKAIPATAAPEAVKVAGPSKSSVPAPNSLPSSKALLAGTIAGGSATVNGDSSTPGVATSNGVAEFIGIDNPDTNKYCAICGSLLWDASKQEMNSGMWDPTHQYGICYSCEGTPAARELQSQYR